MTSLTQAELKSYLSYDPKTGISIRLASKHGKGKTGVVAGNVNYQGYVNIHLAGSFYRAHRLAWLYMTGEWPTERMDHINGIRSDNRWINLREAPGSINWENQRNPRSTGPHSTGFLGVGKERKRFVARIKVHGKMIRLGQYDTPELAHAAYIVAKRQLHEGCTI